MIEKQQKVVADAGLYSTVPQVHVLCINCMLAPSCTTLHSRCATCVALLLETALEPACSDVLGGRLLQLDTITARRYSPLDLCLLQ
jgi:hypothetical protein